MKLARCVTASLLAALSSVVLAQIGPEFQVNTYTPGNQAQTAAAAGGAGSIVVWTSGANIFGQRYDSAGSAQGGEFQLTAPSTIPASFIHVASDAAGNFVVIWQRGSFGSVFGR